MADPPEDPERAGLMTDIANVPAVPGGVMIVSRLSSITIRSVADFPPNRTSVAPENPDPVTVTTVPPAVEPDDGEIPVSSGRGKSYRNMTGGSCGLPTPAEFFTEIRADPGDDDGVVTVRWLSSMTFRSHAYILPNRTFSVPLNPEPVIVTTVPPSMGPEEGEMPDTLGRETPSYWYMADGSVELPAPVALMTETGTVPAGFGGVMMVRRVSLSTFSIVPDFPPNRTSVAPENPDPVMMTYVPPSAGPPEGERPVIRGAEPAAAGPANAERRTMAMQISRHRPGGRVISIGPTPGMVWHEALENLLNNDFARYRLPVHKYNEFNPGEMYAGTGKQWGE